MNLIDRLMGYFESKIEDGSFIDAPFDPSSIQDPRAQETGWDPLFLGGVNFTTRNLTEASASRCSFTAKPHLFLFPTFVAINATVMMSKTFMRFGFNLVTIEIFGILFCLAITLLCLGAIWIFRKPIVFDKNQNRFTKTTLSSFIENGWKTSGSVTLSLDQIIALQIIPKRMSFRSYELNLILKNNDRTNVVNHGNLSSMREDANRLSLFLDVPLWDATSVAVHP